LEPTRTVQGPARRVRTPLSRGPILRESASRWGRFPLRFPLDTVSTAVLECRLANFAGRLFIVRRLDSKGGGGEAPACAMESRPRGRTMSPRSARKPSRLRDATGSRWQHGGAG